LAFGLSHSLFIAMLAFFLFGAGMAGFGTAATTSIQQEIDQAYLGRVSASTASSRSRSCPWATSSQVFFPAY